MRGKPIGPGLYLDIDITASHSHESQILAVRRHREGRSTNSAPLIRPSDMVTNSRLSAMPCTERYIDEYFGIGGTKRLVTIVTAL